MPPPTAYGDAENAKRSRDKATEALQLAELANTDVRWSTLIQIADNYIRTAEQLEMLAESREHMALRVIEEYAASLRAIIKKLSKRLN